MNNLQIASPWMIFSREVEAMFDKDPEVRVEFDNSNVELKLFVESAEKAAALEMVMPATKSFGNVVMKITIIPANSNVSHVFNGVNMDTFKVALKGNGAVSRFKHLEGMGMSIDYVVFKPEIVQYRADNIADLHGINSVLYQDIAYRIFEVQYTGVFFCTDIANNTKLENSEKRTPKFPKDEM